MTNKKRYHYNTLKMFNVELFETLLHEHNVISDNLKELENTDTGVRYQGYYAKKDKNLYFLNKETLKELPVRINETIEEKDGKNIVFVITKFRSFKIKGEKTIPFKILIDELACFEHTKPIDWTLYKIICLASYCGRTFTRISTNPAFGKNSMKNIMNLLTDQVKVVKPRSVPGVLKELTPTGELVLDESSGLKKEIRDLIQEIVLQLGDGSPTYTNGALKSQSHHTKDKYDVHGLSITAMYNRLSDYKGEGEFFDYQFANNSAIKDRLFPLLFEGTLNERFELDFNPKEEAEIHKTSIIQLLKNIQYYKENWRNELKDYNTIIHNCKGRHKQSVEVFFDFINLYSDSEEEYRFLCNELLKRYEAYNLMISKAKEEKVVVIEKNGGEDQLTLDDEEIIVSMEDLK